MVATIITPKGVTARDSDIPLQQNTPFWRIPDPFAEEALPSLLAGRAHTEREGARHYILCRRAWRADRVFVLRPSEGPRKPQGRLIGSHHRATQHLLDFRGLDQLPELSVRNETENESPRGDEPALEKNWKYPG